jgi:predicted  nucleic acid-binding Zn-ribbon protein
VHFFVSNQLVKEEILRKQLELLIQLQVCDLAILKDQRTQEEHPQRIKELEESLEKVKQELQEEVKQSEEMRSTKSGKEQELADEEEKIRKAKEKLNAVKTNKEYQASLKEIECSEKNNVKLEEDILSIMEGDDKLKEKLKNMEEQYALAAKKTEEEKQELEKKLNECEKAIDEQQKIKEGFVAQMESAPLSLYQRIHKKRAGSTVVIVEDGCCRGCHMNIPPQLFNEVKKCQRIISCPHCSRILYWEKNHEEEPLDTIPDTGKC